jgi:hypothetical protein
MNAERAFHYFERKVFWDAFFGLYRKKRDGGA